MRITRGVCDGDAREQPSTARLAGAFLVIGVVLLTIADASLAHVFGVIALFTAAVLAFAAVRPAELADEDGSSARSYTAIEYD